MNSQKIEKQENKISIYNTMRPTRKINTLGKTNKKKLLDYFNFKSIVSARKKLGENYFETMKNLYNQQVDKNRQLNKIFKKETKNLNQIEEEVFNTDIGRSKYKNNFVEVESAFKNTIKAYRIENVNSLFQDASLNMIKQIKPLLIKSIREHKNIIVNLSAYILYDIFGEDKRVPHTLKKARLYNIDDIDRVIDEFIFNLGNMISDYMGGGSANRFIKLLSYDVRISKYQPIKGGSYIDLPPEIKNKKCCINIKNQDDLCLVYCILYHFNKDVIKKDPQRVSNFKPYMNDYDFSKIDFPIKLKDLDKVEKIVDRKINVFSSDLPPTILKSSKYESDKESIDLLLLEDKDKTHFVYIKDFNILCTGGRGNTNFGTLRKRYFCKRCLCSFTSQEKLDEHKEDCSLHKACKRVLPKIKDGIKPTISFKNYNKQVKAPFAIYSDFECILKPINTCLNDNSKSYTNEYQQHEPCGYAIKIVSDYEEYKFPIRTYRGPDPVKHFIDEVLRIEDELLKIVKKMINTEEEDDDNFKHINFPVFFHNLKNYDGHLIIKGLADKNFKNIRIIAQNFEKYLTFSISHLKFLDSCNFLSASLDNLVSNLAKEGEDKFKYTLDGIEDEEQRKLLLQKGVYPYDYMTDEKVFEETQLPPKEKFYSELNECDITDEDYTHAKKVWDTFNIKNMGEYHDLYLETDVNLLADVFENFRNVAMEYYELDPCHYISLPSYAWDAMLKLTGVELENITNIDMYNMISKGLRGGISMITHRHARANNKYMKDYDNKQESSFITYLDANNLYGLAMTKYLPCEGFKFIDAFNIDKVLSTYAENDTGYIVECDLEYPENIHDLHNEYPLAPESRIIKNDELSDYALSLKEKFKLGNSNVPKLVPNLHDKNKYVLHYENLKYYLKQGMKLKQVYRIIEFKQKPFLKSYIDFNSSKRKVAKNDFEKDFFKLMNNAVFGKTMENVENRVDIQLVADRQKYLKRVANPLFKNSQIYDENLVAVEMTKKEIVLDKPIYVGMSILDLSKLHMYMWHYDYIKPKYGDRARLLFTDTDSLTYHIKTDDLYKDMKNDNDQFDFSDYPKDHFCYDVSNKKVLGKFKDETSSVPIVEFIGLRSKMYSVLLENGKHKKTGKGIKKSALNKKISHSHYQRCLKNDEQQMINFNLIRSKKHEIYSYKINKVGLSSYDDKRYLHPNGVSSYSYGHYKITKK